MAIQHPMGVDPNEQLWAIVNWKPILDESQETIIGSSWVASSEAILDGHTKMDDVFSDTATKVKLTGGIVGKSYPWIHQIDTTDASGKAWRRRRTILISVELK